jgi:predicted MFS family arabinose efflux permease
MIGALINLVGAVLQCAAQDLAMILVGRILAGWAVGLMSMSVPIYQTECAHPKTRGQYFPSCSIIPYSHHHQVSSPVSPSK